LLIAERKRLRYFGYKSLVTKAWLQKLGYKSLVTKAWLQKLG